VRTERRGGFTGPGHAGPRFRAARGQGLAVRRAGRVAFGNSTLHKVRAPRPGNPAWSLRFRACAPGARIVHGPRAGQRHGLRLRKPAVARESYAGTRRHGSHRAASSRAAPRMPRVPDLHVRRSTQGWKQG
jgi:hypothetical protein